MVKHKYKKYKKKYKNLIGGNLSDEYLFNFNPKRCNRLYFKELLLLLNNIDPYREKYKRISPKEIKKLKMVCENQFRPCRPDEFFFENKRQIVLGRFFDTVGCFYQCRKHYFTMVMKPYSLFKNDIFIRYMIDKPELFINNSHKIELEKVFPIRIILSKNHIIPEYSDKLMKNIEEYTFDTLKNKLATSRENYNIIKSLPRNSILKRVITQSYPINHIISRELCILYYLNLHFYAVKKSGGGYKPFILVSKYNKNSLKKIYDLYGRRFPNFELLFN